MDESERLLLTPSHKPKINQLIKFDKEYSDSYHLIGTDEAGRGPVAGPVSAAAVCFRGYEKETKKLLKHLDDSKKLSPKRRKELSEEIKHLSYFCISECTVEEIQKLNILQASLFAMKKACDEVVSLVKKDKSPFVLVDGNFIIPKYISDQASVIKGDSKSASIAAASILAKVHRDEFMIGLSEQYPQYEWHKNKGYGTKNHIEAIKKYGITKWHRKKFLEKQISAKQLGFVLE